MSSEISYHWGENELLIDLGNRTELGIKALFWTELVVTTSLATAILLQSFPIEDSWYNTLGAIASTALYLFASYRFLSRMFSTEKLLLKPQYMQIIKRSPFSYKVNEYEWEYIGPLHYVGERKRASELIKATGLDFFGLNSYEKIFYNLNNDGNLFFNYGGFSVKFGKSVYSWDAEEVVNMMRLYKGDKIVLGPEWDTIMHSHEMYLEN